MTEINEYIKQYLLIQQYYFMYSKSENYNLVLKSHMLHKIENMQNKTVSPLIFDF